MSNKLEVNMEIILDTAEEMIEELEDDIEVLHAVIAAIETEAGKYVTTMFGPGGVVSDLVINGYKDRITVIFKHINGLEEAVEEIREGAKAIHSAVRNP